MKVFYHLRYRHSTGADRWVAEAWQGGFTKLGHHFDFYSGYSVNAARLLEADADLFMTDLSMLNGQPDVEELMKLRQGGTRVALYVHWPPAPSISFMEPLLRNLDVADVYYGEREPAAMAAFTRDTGKPYLCTSNAADPRYHFPTEPDPKYAYDIVFIGARLKKKRWMNDLIERRLRPRYNVGLFGPFWSRRDRVLRFFSRGFRKLGLIGLAGLIDRALTMPVEMERVLYSSAKICINFHEREGDGSQSDHDIVNQRTFKIACSGGFQICDNVPGIARNFREGGIVELPLDADLWVATIEKYLNDKDERERLRCISYKTACSQHYAHHRAAMLLSHLGVS